jgi:hypothetical protein
MTRVLLVYFLTFAANLFAQSENIMIGLPNSEIIYSSFDNLIKVSFNYKKIKNVSLTCSECDTIKPNDPDNNEWLIKANKIGTVIITAKDKKGKEVGKKSFRVMQSPAPIVFLDSIDAQSTLSEIPTLVKLNLHPSVPITMGFVVKKWTIIVDDITIDGSGSKLTKDVAVLLRKNKSGTIIIMVDYMSAFGHETIKEIFQYDLK